VTGERDEEYYVWDPDASETAEEHNMTGAITLRKLFEEYPNDEIEFWEYEVVVT